MTVNSKSATEPFSTLMNRFKKKLRKSGILTDYGMRSHYKKPSEVRKEKEKKQKNKIRYELSKKKDKYVNDKF